MPRVYVSIGSNIEKNKNIRAAIRALRARFSNVTFSSVYESEAEGFDGDDFYNLAAAFDTDAPLEEVCDLLTEIETAQGRTRTGPRFGPRTLDIDVLLYGDLVRHDDRFDVPRRDVTAYAHVLGPLVEIAPDLLHPETGERLAELWQRFAGRQTLRRVAFAPDAGRR